MNRRFFLSVLAGLPVIGKYFNADENPYIPQEYKKRMDICPCCRKTPRCKGVEVRYRRESLPSSDPMGWTVGRMYMIECCVNPKIYERV